MNSDFDIIHKLNALALTLIIGALGFSHANAAHVKVVCREKTEEYQENPNYIDHVRRFAEETIEVGGQELAKLNPGLGRHFVETFERVHFKINCKMPIEDGRGAFVVPRILFLKPTLYVDTFGEAAHLSIDPHFFQSEVAKLVRDGVDIPFATSVTKRTIRTQRNLLFHELLHIAKIRNNSNESHNGIDDIKDDIERRNAFSRDLVYACAEAVFPEEEQGAEREDVELHSLSVETCRTTELSAHLKARY